MNRLRFLNLLFITSIIFTEAIAGQIDPQETQHIDCILQPRERASKHHYDFKPTNKDDEYASFSHPHMPLFEGTSQNWSGYAAFLKHSPNNSVTAVAGSWIVPTLSAASHQTYCSLWVGIDGYSSGSVEQIGTEHDWYNGAQHNYAWFEMYPNGSYEIIGFPVNPGDVITASVVYQGHNVFILTITNVTRHVSTTIPISYTTSSSAKRSSAEWVMEAPYSGSILPLSHFNTAYFSNCTATINNVHGAINNHTWSDDELEMVTSNGTPKAVPSALSSNGQNFSVTWHHE